MDVVNASTVSKETIRPPGAKLGMGVSLFYTLHAYKINEERGEFYYYAFTD